GPFTTLLRKAGMQIKLERNPMKVLDTLEEFRPDLILMDLYMPDCDGMELTAIIRERDPFINTPIEDVLFTFSEFSGRSIVAGTAVVGTVTADIRNQAWDDALEVILQSRGLIAIEDRNGIIRVDGIENLNQREAFEPLEELPPSRGLGRAEPLKSPVDSPTLWPTPDLGPSLHTP
ncbi:MAG: response regulator, partial [Acidobacteria bacterium]|nr:response regulator [Acidobacteriota bacterium]